jgi:23S rRNA (uracil1939-C5)-methyltransferase
MSSELRTFTVEKLGGLGDGVIDIDGKPAHLPMTMPGDVVRVLCSSRRPKLVEIIEPSPQRQAPQCTHYGQCGGCSLQHLPETMYQDLKRQRLVTALSRAGYKVDADAIDYYAVPAHSRRRAHFAIAASQSGVELGFYQRKSHRLVPLKDCAVLAPELLQWMQAFAAMAATLPGRYHMEQLHISLSAQGGDMVLVLSNPIAAADQLTMINWAKEKDLARLTLVLGEQQADLVCTRQPSVTRGDYEIAIPNGPFLQATSEAEDWIQAAIAKLLPPAPAKVVDLYAGLATYSGVLAGKGYELSGYEGSADMVNAVRYAKTDVEPMRFYVRDLFVQPLTVPELENTQAAIINPPRNGAEPQFRMLAESNVPYVILVSCDVASLERDVAWLEKAGYKLSYAGLIDQFLWTGHVESVLLFTK